MSPESDHALRNCAADLRRVSETLLSAYKQATIAAALPDTPNYTERVNNLRLQAESLESDIIETVGSLPAHSGIIRYSRYP